MFFFSKFTYTITKDTRSVRSQQLIFYVPLYRIWISLKREEQLSNKCMTRGLWEPTDHCQVDPEVPGGWVVEVDSAPEDTFVTLHDLGDLQGSTLAWIRASGQEVAAFALLVSVRPVEGVVERSASSVQAVTEEVSDMSLHFLFYIESTRLRNCDYLNN